MAGRFIAGMAIGQLVSTSLEMTDRRAFSFLVSHHRNPRSYPVYQSEIAHPSNRGQLTALFQVGQLNIAKLTLALPRRWRVCCRLDWLRVSAGR